MGIEIQPVGTPVSTAGGTSGTVPVNEVPGNPVSATAAVNTQVQITIASQLFQSVRLTSLSVSYNAAPTGGVLTVTSNGVTILQLDITAAGPTAIPLPAGGMEGVSSNSVIITLSAAGAAVAGRVNVSSYYGT